MTVYARMDWKDMPQVKRLRVCSKRFCLAVIPLNHMLRCEVTDVWTKTLIRLAQVFQ